MSTVIKGSGSGQINLNDTTGSIQLNGSDVLTIDSSGNLTVPNNLTSTGGIYLGGTASGNLLDDYEEGTWTPTLSFNFGSTGITYSLNAGQYTKIGDVVTVKFNVQLTNKGSSTGNARVEGLPFAAINNNVESHNHPYMVAVSHAGNLTAYVPNGQNYVSFVDFNDTGSTAFIDNTNFSNTSIARCTLIYHTTA